MASQGHTYHWKHGWIPLDHAAAVQKFGSSAAAKRHGFSGQAPNPPSVSSGSRQGSAPAPLKTSWGGAESSPEADRAALRSRLDGLAATPKVPSYMQDVADFTQEQFDHDPNAGLILDRGKSMDASSVTRMHGIDGECHWNVSKLHEQGKVDGIVIGFAYDGDVGWIQHTWGVKGGKVVETNVSSRPSRYFGAQLTPDEADSFAAWTKANPPGGGVVRRA